MRQLNLASASFDKHSKQTRRAKFLAEMDQVVPWRELCALVAPFYPRAGNGRPPIGLERMLRLHFLQHWYDLSDPAAREAVYDSLSLRRFVVIDLGREPVPDETTIRNFRRLLDRYRVTTDDHGSFPRAMRTVLGNGAASNKRLEQDHSSRVEVGSQINGNVASGANRASLGDKHFVLSGGNAEGQSASQASRRLKPLQIIQSDIEGGRTMGDPPDGDQINARGGDVGGGRRGYAAGGLRDCSAGRQRDSDAQLLKRHIVEQNRVDAKGRRFFQLIQRINFRFCQKSRQKDGLRGVADAVTS
jgi:hypothetical protein